MEVALYWPGEGYYERDSNVIGRRGDYYTNVSTGSLFGSLLAFQFAEWLDELSSGRVQLVEIGAHDGQLAADILACLGRKRPELAKRLDYWIVEPSGRRKSWQAEKLARFSGQIHWLERLGGFPEPGVEGVIFSNEWLDALPVRRFGWDGSTKEWFEWGVNMDLDRFAWARIPLRHGAQLAEELSNAGLDLPGEVLAALPDGFTVEFCPGASRSWAQAASSLQRGRLVTFDYGSTAQELFVPERPQGTLRAYRQHRLSSQLLAEPGEQDLTAHVNFTQILRIGESAGLRTEGLLTQERFLTRIAQQLWRDDTSEQGWCPAQPKQFKILTHPEHLGHAFKVLVQTRH